MTLGNDRWVPASLFVFGDGPQGIIPLVHIPNWDLGPMSTDPAEGQSALDLPLARLPN
jgi:hypothetical protein